MVRMVTDPAEKSRIAEEVLTALPDWFGVPESLRQYVETCADMPFWAYEDVGFIVMKSTSRYTADIYVMGVKQYAHRKGIGTALVQELQKYAKETGHEYLQVKTVQKGNYAEYDQTCAFYEAMGFRELECFPTLWDEKNPCQIYVKAI